MASVWGSRVWTLLHRLSFYSNRHDIRSAWKNSLRILQETLPCAICRNHMKDYITKNPVQFPNTMNGALLRDTIVMWLYNFHNHVNVSNGHEEYPVDMMELKYGQGSYESAVADAKRIMAELDGMWTGVPCREWKLSISYLCSLIIGGPL